MNERLHESSVKDKTTERIDMMRTGWDGEKLKVR